MPHLVLEHSSELDPSQITSTCDALFKAACADPVFTDIASIKVRSLPCYNVRMGLEPQSFAHLTIWLLSGRSVADKQALAQRMLTVLRDHLPEVGAVTVNPTDMTRDSYAKHAL